MSGGIQKKRSQPSRKGKKAWRKNVDITDIEEGQEELRSIERIVGHNKELKNEELFTIDVAGDSGVKRKLAKDRPLRIDQILDQRSAVPAVKSKNAFKKPETTQVIESKHEFKSVDKILKRKSDAPIKPVSKKKVKVSTDKSYDLWDEPAAAEQQPNTDFLPVKAKLRVPKTVTEKPAGLIHLAAVDTPEGGHSYNPDVIEHQKLLVKANEVEERKIEVLKKLQEQLSYRDELKLLAGELSNTEITAEGKIISTAVDEEEQEEDLEDKPTDDKATKKRKAAERKTRAQRHKSHRLATEELEKKQKLQERAIRQQIDILRQIEEELKIKNEELKINAEKRGERQAEEEKKGLKKLGKYTVPELPVDVQLTDELCETLRQLKPEGNMFRERFHSIQKRNIIEPRIPVIPSRKYKLKEYERRGYKNFDQLEDIKKKRATNKK
ncbi:ribosome biogenesis protein Nop53/GLTSCR2 [Thamnidium elegans]|uniref:Ribosome biogenesis protein NOP53 n=1 Tax=Thamnidium elegans TaxID=101142 RepID=A0A8H7T078_9FUNG|nr:hypothetical protein INT48_009628 [Thamnidium elegans]KAI8080564.1 ribosome biogenesis protein Nop53/GLTSCR2 [Thamnidium elegans]